MVCVVLYTVHGLYCVVDGSWFVLCCRRFMVCVVLYTVHGLYCVVL